MLAPQGLDYVAGFFAAVKSGAIAVPLFAPELPGHAERLETALVDARPALVLTTGSTQASVTAFLDRLPGATPEVVVIDRIPDTEAAEFDPVAIDEDDVSHLQYTSGSTRPPIGVEITHRAVGTNLVQMIFAIDLLNRNTHGVSWLPLYHDMGLSMIGFPATYGGHSTLMSPTAFVRRPQRWIKALSDGSRVGRVVTAAPNFAYEWTAQRGRPQPGEDIDLSNVVMIIGSEPVSMDAIESFTEVFAPHGLPSTAIKPSYGIAEATLMVATIAPDAVPAASYFDAERLAAGEAVRVDPAAPSAVAHVSCGQAARSLWVVIVTRRPARRSPTEWWGRSGCTAPMWAGATGTDRSRPAESSVPGWRPDYPPDSRAEGVPADADWLRTTDLGMFVDGDLYVTGRIVDLITVQDRHFYPQDIEATTAEASPLVRRGYVTAFTAPDLVIVAERAPGTTKSDPTPAVQAIRSAVARRHGLTAADVMLLPAGAIPRTTSGKLARRACRAEYLDGSLKAKVR